jgi:hypothetical protein
LIAAVVIVPYSFWIVFAVVQKRWRQVVVLLALLVLLFFGLLTSTSILNGKAHSEYLTGLFDAQIRLGSTIYEYSSQRSFTGDGYSLSVYEIPKVVRARFDAADEQLLTEHPKLPSYRSHWNAERWREAPLAEAFQKYLEFALSHYDSTRAPELKVHFSSIREAVSRDRVFYSFFHHDHGSRPANIDLFILDLAGGGFT